jgi:hypothetical protein
MGYCPDGKSFDNPVRGGEVCFAMPFSAPPVFFFLGFFFFFLGAPGIHQKVDIDVGGPVVAVGSSSSSADSSSSAFSGFSFFPSTICQTLQKKSCYLLAFGHHLAWFQDPCRWCSTLRRPFSQHPQKFCIHPPINYELDHTIANTELIKSRCKYNLTGL